MCFSVEIVFKEIKTLKYVGLFDVNAAKDSVPTPLLINGALGGG